ncbi:glutathione S-transferase T3-like [Brassica napus]|uniref:glutathione S-transferase T3-like n=1 Tax=Brassica napus TaxID=3708 RepID=UPI0006AA5FF0|nr:glutathione S-transferase T3-like [Brassica napus]
MDSNSYTPLGNFVDLLNSLQDNVFGYVQDSVEVSSSQVPLFSSQPTDEETPAERKERRAWTAIDDVTLISAWLNTSKDPMVANEQRAGAFWKMIVALCSKSQATREKSNSQNENDVLKHAHEIFYNNHKKKLTLEHAWKELRNDQKWCEFSSPKTTTSDEQATIRPAGDKASKRHGKKTMADGKALNEFESMWRIRKEDLAAKERLTKMRLLDSLIGKEYLAEYKVAFKKKLIDELLSN